LKCTSNTRKCHTSLKKLTQDEHSSLFFHSVSDEEKKDFVTFVAAVAGVCLVNTNLAIACQSKTTPSQFVCQQKKTISPYFVVVELL
jgi:hypothetical protein